MPVFNNILAGAAGQAGGAAAAGPIKSVRFNSDDSAYLNRTPSSASNRKTWTWSGWVKRSSLTSSYENLFSSGDGGNNWLEIGFSSQKVYFYWQDASSGTNIQTSDSVHRDCSAWLHLVVAVDTTQSSASDRLKIYVNGSQITMSGTNPTQDFETAVNNTFAHGIGSRVSESNLYFDGYLADIYFIDGQALDPTDFGAFDDNGVWQAAEYSGTFGTNGYHLFDFANESGIGDDSSGNDNDWTANNLTPITTLNTTGVTTTVPEDLTGDWFGILNVTPTDTNGAVAVFPDGSGVSNSRGTFFWSGLTSGDTITWYGTSSGQNRQVTGDVDESTVDVPGGTLGSFSLTVNAASGSAKIDFNGSANCYGITPGVTTSLNFDVLRDVPTNGDSSDDTGAGGEVSGNYATLNPLSAIGGATISNGNLEGRIDGAATEALYGTIAMSSGKWYWEFTNTSVGAMHGIADLSYADNNWYDGTGGYCYYSGTGNKYQNSNVNSSYGDSYGSGDVIGVAFDADNGDLYFYKNGTVQNSGTAAFTGLSGTFAPIFQDGLGGGNVHTFAVNFGARSFAYSAPSGYKPLCTTLLPTPTIADGSNYFDVSLWDGNSGTTSIDDLEFSPDWVWLKSRSAATYAILQDTVRGDDKALYLGGNSGLSAEATITDSVTSFNSDGYTLGSRSIINYTGRTYVGWAWDAGSSTASNTDGSQTSQVRVNQTAGFSIATFNTPSPSANFTYGHGLNSAPEFVIHKFRDVSSNWYTYHTSIGQKYILLNSNGAAATSEFTTAPTSSVFTYPSSLIIGSDNPMVAYSFTSVAGYSAFGSYTGNGSSDGPFVFLGFKPALLIIKIYSGTSSNWVILDSTRDPDNVVQNNLYADASDAENSFDWADFLSNGFKPRVTYSQVNGSGYDYIYMAWAENPFSSNGGLAR